MANRIFYNPDGYIEVIIEGDQTDTSFFNLQPDAETMTEEMQEKGQKLLALIDVTRQGKFTADSNKAAMTILEAMNYDRVALFGAGKVIEEVFHAIVMAMGKSSNTKIFPDRESAVDWLFSPET